LLADEQSAGYMVASDTGGRGEEVDWMGSISSTSTNGLTEVAPIVEKGNDEKP
jgi:hypothetical protein